MKKTIVLLVLLAYVCVIGCSFADVYEKPILFRETPWDTPYSEVVEKFPNKYDYHQTISNHTYGEGVDFLMKGLNRKKYGDCGFFYRSNAMYSTKVAGYSVNEMAVIFAYEPGEDGLLIKDYEQGKIVLWEYDFRINGLDEFNLAIDDMIQKLTRVYGDMDYKSEETYNQYYTWFGADGTMVSLVRETSHSGDTYSFEVRYSYEGAIELLEKAQAAADYEFSLNTDGL